MHTPSFYRIYGLPLFVQRFLVMAGLVATALFYILHIAIQFVLYSVQAVVPQAHPMMLPASVY